jgi:hypothetical protein
VQQKTSTSSNSSLAVHDPVEKCRKLIDLNPDTSTALVIQIFHQPDYHMFQKTHKILSDENFGLDTEYVQNNTAIQHRRYIVNDFTSADVSQEQVLNKQIRFVFN